VGAAPGAHSAVSSWEAAAALRPDLIAVMLCGFGLPRALGELEALHDAAAGAHSAVSSWDVAAALRPDLIAVMLCGFGLARALSELEALHDAAADRLLRSAPVWVLDGNTYTSRPGPRIVDGAELLQAAMRGEARPGLAAWRPAR
jgi:ABC-type hemin transport system substrate-binding protein